MLAAPTETGSLNAHLEPLRVFLNKTWRGTFKESTPEKPMIDVSHYERAMNGQAIRVLHSVNDGMYGGESLIYWDEGSKSVRYFYLTTAGFRTEGTMTLDKGKITSVEKVEGETNGIALVRAVSELTADGHLKVKADYLDKGGKVVGGRETDYVEDSKAIVKFK